ncbi:MAG: methyltransferase [archaeon]
MNKKELAVRISKLKKIEDLDIKLEQYNLDSEIASQILWNMHMNNDIKDKVIGDFGCGSGLLGYGCLLLGAKKVYFIDKDIKNIKITRESIAKDIVKENFKDKRAVFFNIDIKDFNKKIDVVVQNPPFGTKIRKADKIFLEKALELGDKIYSLHKIESKKFIESLIKDKGFVKQIIEIKLPLRKSYRFHKRKVYYVNTGLWVIERFKKI